MDTDKFEEKLKEIENLQKEFENIFMKRNFFIRWINFKKAEKINLLAKEKIQELYMEMWIRYEQKRIYIQNYNNGKSKNGKIL